MVISEKLMKFKYHFIFGTLASLLSLYLFFLAPKILNVLAYFWPLFVSTALLLAVVLFFGWVHPSAAEASGEKTGEGLLDYVAGQPELLEEAQKSV